VELYGGKVWIEGAEGSGCAVLFTVPSFQEHEGASKVLMQESRIPRVVDVFQRGVL